MTSPVSSSPAASHSGNPRGRWFDDRKIRSKILIAVGAVAIAGIVSGLVGVSKLGTLYQAGKGSSPTTSCPPRASPTPGSIPTATEYAVTQRRGAIRTGCLPTPGAQRAARHPRSAPMLAVAMGPSVTVDH